MFVFGWQLLSHPFILLVTGAALSGVIIPYATDKWKDKQRQLETAKQDYQRDLDIKNELVANIARSVSISTFTDEYLYHEAEEIFNEKVSIISAILSPETKISWKL
jgi:hypothetical protein